MSSASFDCPRPLVEYDQANMTLGITEELPHLINPAGEDDPS